VAGTNPKLDKAIALKNEIDNLLKQDVEDKFEIAQTIEMIFQIANQV
jgi:flagellar biosynthesis/type III secretory pathway ATPase